MGRGGNGGGGGGGVCGQVLLLFCCEINNAKSRRLAIIMVFLW